MALLASVEQCRTAPLSVNEIGIRRYRQNERHLLLVARSHKKQQKYHREQTRETMERLRELREKMARLGIPVEVVEKK